MKDETEKDHFPQGDDPARESFLARYSILYVLENLKLISAFVAQKALNINGRRFEIESAPYED
jgi:hypothetical protein